MNLTHVILGPVNTEKSVVLAEDGQHVIYVHMDATKEDVRSAAKKFFAIDITDVRMIKMPEKFRVRGKFGQQVKRKRRKKAIVRVRDGKNFDLLSIVSKKTAKKKATVKKDTPKSAPKAEKKTEKIGEEKK